MDLHKISNHKSETDGQFPAFEPIQGEELTTLKNKIYKIFSEKFNINLPLDMVKTQEIVSSRFPKNASEENFSLSEAFEYFGTHPKDQVYVNWGKFDDIDRMPTSDLIRAFSSVWYSESDDIEIFDEDLSWMVAVAHDGTVELRFSF
ncbi:hypothetical protein ACW9IK_19880 [Pseudomonas gingeri]